jgi:hypothetical protein
MPFMQKTIVYACVLLLFIISCNDKDSPIDPKNEPVKKCRLVKLIQGTHNGAANDTTFNFYYDATGKLNMVTDFYAGYPGIDTLLLTYNDSGKLIKAIPAGYTNASTFTYTSNGQLSEIYYPRNGYEKWRFVYNGSSNLPEKCIKTTYLSSPGSTHLDSVEYRYIVQNGNIVSKETFSKGVSVGKSTFEYDTIPNLNANLSLISLRYEALGFSDEISYFNKNLIKKNVYTYLTYSFPYNVSYKLDSGKVVQSLTYEATPPGDTRNYFWECQ